MKNRWPTTMSGGLMIATLLGVITASILFGNRGEIAVSETPAQAAPLASNQATETIEGSYRGTVKLAWVVSGVYSTTLTAPTPAPEGSPSAPDLGSINLVLDLNQMSNAVRGYVGLEQALTFSTLHTLTDGTETGPNVSGAVNGNSLTLTSERFETTLDNKTFMRQFQLTGQVDATADNISGEYRETLWGYSEEPYTISGNVTLQQVEVYGDSSNTSNTAPTTTVDRGTTSQGKAVTINVLANDSDADDDTLTVTSVSLPQFGIATTNGQSIIYTPNANFVGEDQFTYFVSDGNGGTAAGSVTVTVTGPNGPNRAPAAGSDVSTTSSGNAVTIDVLANDSDPDGDTLTVTIETQPGNGTATVSGGKIVYTPVAGFVGTDTLQYTVSDSKGGTASATVTITVGGPGGSTKSPTVYLPLYQ